MLKLCHIYIGFVERKLNNIQHECVSFGIYIHELFSLIHKEMGTDDPECCNGRPSGYLQRLQRLMWIACGVITAILFINVPIYMKMSFVGKRIIVKTAKAFQHCQLTKTRRKSRSLFQLLY